MNETESERPKVVQFPVKQRAVDVEGQVLAALEEALESLDDVMDPADQKVIDDEHAFIKRFRFDAPAHRRRQVIELKHRVDLTDREIRVLHRSGSLVFDRGVASVYASLMMSVWGWVQFIALMAVMTLALLAGHSAKTVTPSQVLVLATLELMLLGMCAAVFQLHVLPRRIWSRVREVD